MSRFAGAEYLEGIPSAATARPTTSPGSRQPQALLDDVRHVESGAQQRGPATGGTVTEVDQGVFVHSQAPRVTASRGA
jgi:hypothetical protein